MSCLLLQSENENLRKNQEKYLGKNNKKHLRHKIGN